MSSKTLFFSAALVLIFSASKLSSNKAFSRKLINCHIKTIKARGLIYKTVRGIVTKSVRTPKSQTYKNLRMHTSKQSLLYKSQSAYKCAQLNQLHVPPCIRPFLTINGQCKLPHECDLHIKLTQMQVLCLVGNNGRITEKSKIAKFRGG